MTTRRGRTGGVGCVCRRSRRPLLILDWEMPKVDGLELCRRIRSSERGDVPFILVVTARDRTEDLSAVLDAGADDYIVETGDARPPDGATAHRRAAHRDQHRAPDRRGEAAKGAVSRGNRRDVARAAARDQQSRSRRCCRIRRSSRRGCWTRREQEEALATIAQMARRIAEVVKRLQQLDNPTSVEYARQRAHDRHQARRRASGPDMSARFLGSHPADAGGPVMAVRRAASARHAGAAAVHGAADLLQREGPDQAGSRGEVPRGARRRRDRAVARAGARRVRAQHRVAGGGEGLAGEGGARPRAGAIHGARRRRLLLSSRLGRRRRSARGVRPRGRRDPACARDRSRERERNAAC